MSLSSIEILASLPSGAFIFIGLLLAIIPIGFSFRAHRRKRIIDHTPTSKVRGIFMGLVEVKGTAEVGYPLRSFLAEQFCVYYDFSVREHWSRIVRETYRDSEGRTRTRTRRESGWSTVASDKQMLPFYLKDETGAVLVDPYGASITADTVFDQHCTRGDWLYYGKGPAHSVSNSDHRRHFVEKAILLHRPLYTIGQAFEREDIVAPMIGHHTRAPFFMISTKREESISQSYSLQYWLLGILGAVLAVGGAIFSLASGANAEPGNSFCVPLLGAGVYLFAWLVGSAWISYNSMITLRNRVNQAYSNVEVQLKRRHDLIPNIVRVVKAYQRHERETFELISNLRSQANATKPGLAGDDPKAVAPTLRALVEAYPDLKANQQFGKLQQSLIKTEQRIALAREYYNDIVAFYNRQIQVVPDNYLAKFANLKPEKFIEASNFERQPVEINFQN